MSRRPMAYGAPCHDGEEWTCAGCLRIQCNRCDGIAGDNDLCWECTNTEDPMDGDAA